MYLADRGDFHVLDDLSETLDNQNASRGVADLVEYFVLQVLSLLALLVYISTNTDT